MGNGHVFISHASADDGFVKELRQALEDLSIPVWVDSRELVGGNKLAPEITQAIDQAQHVLVVLSPKTVNSPWVRKEVQQALQIEKQRNDGYRVIPLLLPGLTVGALGNWFDEEPVAVPLQLNPGGLSEALPAILAALGERLPTDHQAIQTVTAKPVAELLLELEDAQMQTEEGKHRVTATAKVLYQPADIAPPVESRRFRFTAPIGPIEAEELRWYLERYYLWPVGVFQQRAEEVAKTLPQWGQALYTAITKSGSAQDALTAWQHAAERAERRFSLLINDEPPEGSSPEQQTHTRTASSALLSLPWELLHDGRGYLFQGNAPACVRRRLPNRYAQPALATALPIRILLVSPRPEDEYTSYLDHRVSALPLVEAVEQLGELATLTVLTPPTFPALEKALQAVAKAGQRFDVVHFDGHGVYDREHGLGGLCFEDPTDSHQLQKRTVQLIHADQLAAMMRAYRIPLVFLEACQSAQVDDDPTSSVAAKLLAEGVSSVVAMSHSVLVETARRFVQAFYGELAQGSRVGQAMMAGQQALFGDTYRGKIMGAGELRLQDWFVPVLYQEEYDPQLITRVPPHTVRQLQAQQRAVSMGALPATPTHTFIGRSRDLLALERLLHDQPYAVVVGPGGVGKTTLAVELARWLVRTGRARRAAFVSVETLPDVRAVLDSLGRQLLPQGEQYSVAEYPDLKQALQPVQRALADAPTLIVLDNLESVLPDASGQASAAAAPVGELFALCQTLLNADPATRVVFTSREALPAPFDHQRRTVRLGTLSQDDAIALVSQVMAQEGIVPQASDAGMTPQEITDLVDAVQCHPRALVLLARELSRRGVRATTATVRALMAELDRRHPGERENSLYASVELSLRRLSPEMREQVKALAVFHGGANIAVLAMMLDIEVDAAQSLAAALMAVGLAEERGEGHFWLDPALPTYLGRELSAAEQEAWRSRWAEGMQELTVFLSEQYVKEAALAAQVTLLELPNLLALLGWMQVHATPEDIVNEASHIEALLARRGRPQALAQVTAMREQAARDLGAWSHARYLTESATIDRLFERGEVQAAYTAVQHLLPQALQAGEAAYAGADYDVAMTYWRLGRILRLGGATEAALQALSEAQERFQTLVDVGYSSAEQMVATTMVKTGDCLTDLGRLDDAASVYGEAITRSEKLHDQRGVAVTKGQLATVRLFQQRYDEALTSYAEAREMFTTLNEPNTVAGAWHQIGVVHRYARQFDQAEQAYRQSLAIRVQQNDLAGQSASLGELGTLYAALGRTEQAVTFSRQAAEIYVKLQDRAGEGRARQNLAIQLIELQRYQEARQELQQAIACEQSLGHAAQPWKTWAALWDLERAVGNPDAAAVARQQAIDSYLAYRRAGGENREASVPVFAAVTQAIASGQTAELEHVLTEVMEDADTTPKRKVLCQKLLAVLNGVRDLALANDSGLDFQDAVELQLLLEQVSVTKEGRRRSAKGVRDGAKGKRRKSGV